MNKLLNTTLTVTILLTALLASSCKKQPDKELSYEGVYFTYPSYWDVETEQLDEDVFYISCTEKFSKSTIFLVQFALYERDGEELIESYLETLEESFSVEKEPLKYGKFGGYDCLYVKYKMERFREKAYGIVYVFSAGEKSILAVKQSKRDYELKHEKYNNIEKSFRASEPDVSETATE
ncbi:MAG: hypothetical protein LBV43_14280 [Prevotella sp.]|jgi:hypothetical protein|nr:hypothetical protein [Prevotella sp.]